jgi:GMP synthase (glutamine-hydrolysing)
MKKKLIYIMDMESSLSDALVRRVIDMGQYIHFRKWDMKVDAAAELAAYKDEIGGLIISGSAKNINSQKHASPMIPPELFQAEVPILAICYGMQYLAHIQGVPIVRCWNEQDLAKRTDKSAKKDEGEQGVTFFRQYDKSKLFLGLGEKFPVWMKHNWMLQEVPPGWKHTGGTARCPVAAMEFGNTYAVQFHPEPSSSLFGRAILHNFFTHICGLDTPYF